MLSYSETTCPQAKKVGIPMTDRPLSEDLRFALAHTRAEEPFTYEHIIEKSLDYTSEKEATIERLPYDKPTRREILCIVMVQHMHGYGNIIDHLRVPLEYETKPMQTIDAVLPQLMKEYKDADLDMNMLDMLRDTMTSGRDELGDDEASRCSRLFGGRAFIDGMLAGRSDDESGLARTLADMEPRNAIADQTYKSSTENFAEVIRSELKPTLEFMDRVKPMTGLDPNALVNKAAERTMTMMRAMYEPPSGMAFAEDMNRHHDVITAFMTSYVFAFMNFVDSPESHSRDYVQTIFRMASHQAAQDAMYDFSTYAHDCRLDTSEQATACALCLTATDATQPPPDFDEDVVALATACAFDDVAATRPSVPSDIRPAWHKNVTEPMLEM